MFLERIQMKIGYAIVVVLLVGISFGVANVAYGQLDATRIVYSVTTDYHGIDVPIGTLVTATAGTTDTDVQNVTFLWLYPNETVAHTDANVQVWSNGSTFDGELIFFAQSSYRPDVLGDWGVIAFFIGEGGRTKHDIDDVIRIRATSFYLIPDLPTVGTAGAAATMLLGLGLYIRKKKH